MLICVVGALSTGRMRVHNNNARGIVQSGKSRDEPYTDAGLTGSTELRLRPEGASLNC